MACVHTINLRHAWTCGEISGGVRFRRRFHRPTGIGPEIAVDLVIAAPHPADHVCLNGARLSPKAYHKGVLRFRINEHLQRFNELIVDVEHPRTRAPSASQTDSMSTEWLLENRLGNVRLEFVEQHRTEGSPDD